MLDALTWAFCWLVLLLVIGGGTYLLYLLRHNSLPQRFQRANPLRGKTRGQIIALVGNPNSVSTYDNGKTLLQWIQSGYHIALIFDANGVCEGVQHEFKHPSHV
jgi:hypothetical protein